MASSSSVSAAAAATYQVFLSFRGPDTRRGFTDVLYHALLDAGVRVFRDNEEIRKGEEIGEEILRAIEESRIFVPIFSKGYASSKWCLIEFTKMVELKEGSSGKKIIPIFYDVGVEDVKLRTDLYTEALKEHSKKYGCDTVKPWDEALRQAGKFKGWELKDKGHAELAKLVVRDVSMKLKVKHKSVTEYLVQRDDQVEALMKLVDTESSDVLFVGIYGMGGIGKSTLAKIVFNKLCDRFDGCSFLANVRESIKQHKGTESLQKQLLGDLVHESEDIMDVDDGMRWLREKLGRKNVLIVLDDVGSKEQIHNLAGDASWFGLGSRIIITTRDRSVLELRRLGIQTLKVEELKAEEASRLFCMHAFQNDFPPDDYLSLSEEAVRSTGRLPLALAVIGSFLGEKPRKEWTNTIERLKKVPHEDVQKKLMISYESLSHETKQIFLDIACFFIGHEKTYPIYMWQACDFNPEIGLKELINLSLVKIIVDKDGDPSEAKRKKLWMHDQLRDLARNIVKADRIWMTNDALKMLQEQDIKGKENVEMIRLSYHDDPAKGYTFTKRDLSRFGNLRYFECYSGDDDDSWKSRIIPDKLRGISGHLYPPLLPKLRWLSWQSFPPKFWRVKFCLRNLVILNLSGSDIDENWRGWKQFGVGSPLKVLDLSDCKRFTRTPDLSVFSTLEMLILNHCTNLLKIDPSIGVMKSLVELDLSWTRVAELPDTVGQLVKLEVLLLHGCESLEKLPSFIGNLESLRVMDMGSTTIKEIPYSFRMLKRLEKLDASWTYLEEIPSTTIEGLDCLRVLKLVGTDLRLLPSKLPTGLIDVEIDSRKILLRVPEFSNLQNLVRLVLQDNIYHEGSDGVEPLKLEGIGKLCRLVELELDLWNVTCIPEEEFSSPLQLQKLYLGCPNLQHCPPLPSTLSDLTLEGHPRNVEFPRLSNLKNLLALELQDCSISHDTFGDLGVGELQTLTSLTLDDCEFGNLRNGLHLLANIRKLHIKYCSSLEPLLALSQELKNLKELIIHGEHELVEIPELGELESLTSLSLRRCGFGILDGLHLPANLRQLHIDHCESLEALHALSHLKNLRELSIEGAKKLVEIPELGELESLRVLSIEGCGSLRGTLQNLSKLKMLGMVEILGCPNFKGIEGICELESLASLWIKDCDCEDVEKYNTHASL